MEAQQIQERLNQILANNERLIQQNADLQAQLNAHSVQNPAAYAVRPKLPPFWHEHPAGWFAHLESQFVLCQITVDETKYNYVVSQFDSRISHEVEDLVTNPPAKGSRYEWIKEEVIKRFSTSESQKVRQLLSGEELGDRKPTQFLRHLKSLAGKTFTDDKIIRELWLQRLPKNVQAILTAQGDLTLDKVAELADKILEVNPVSVHAISPVPASACPDLAAITAQIQELSRQVAALTTSHSNSRQRSSSRSKKPRSRSASQVVRQPLCWYHQKFGEKASKCNKPCSWSGNQQSNL